MYLVSGSWPWMIARANTFRLFLFFAVDRRLAASPALCSFWERTCQGQSSVSVFSMRLFREVAEVVVLNTRVRLGVLESMLLYLFFFFSFSFP